MRNAGINLRVPRKAVAAKDEPSSIAAGEELGMCHRHLHQRHEGIDRAEAHRVCEVRNGGIRPAQPTPDETGEIRRPQQVRIQQQRLIDTSGAGVEIADDSPPRRHLFPCDCVFSAQTNRLTGQTSVSAMSRRDRSVRPSIGSLP